MGLEVARMRQVGFKHLAQEARGEVQIRKGLAQCIDCSGLTFGWTTSRAGDEDRKSQKSVIEEKKQVQIEMSGW